MGNAAWQTRSLAIGEGDEGLDVFVGHALVMREQGVDFIRAEADAGGLMIHHVVIEVGEFLAGALVKIVGAR